MTDIDVIIDSFNFIMDKKDITKAKLARDLDIDKNSIGNYLNKPTTMPAPVLIRIAQYLEVDITKLCKIKESRTLTPIESNLISELNKIDEPYRLQLALELANLISLFDRFAINSNRE